MNSPSNDQRTAYEVELLEDTIEHIEKLRKYGPIWNIMSIFLYSQLGEAWDKGDINELIYVRKKAFNTHQVWRDYYDPWRHFKRFYRFLMRLIHS
jgi:hypothetical protein